MSFNTDFEINRIEFNNSGINSIKQFSFVEENWPVVYILNDNSIKKAYIGETIDINSRMSSHLNAIAKKEFKEAHFISSNKFNKSATLDIESNLIKYLHADGNYKLLNGNLGLVYHSYYQREEYYNLFKEIWNSLISKGIAQHSLEYITNSDIFKYSPYKTLSIDQRKNLMLIIDALISDDKKSIFIEGGAGTGKTILAIFLFKLMLTSDEDFNYKEFGVDEQEFINKVKILKRKYPSPKMGLVIAMSSFRQTIRNVFSNIQGLSRNLVIGPSDLAKSDYDILFVDEAHRLRQRVNLTNYASFDNTARSLGLDPQKTNELEWTQLRSKKALYFYDPKQSIKPTDVSSEAFNNIKKGSNSMIVQLFSQFRSKGGNGWVQFVDNLLDQSITDENFKYNYKDYDVLLFKDFKDFVTELKRHNNQHKLCRFVAGYGWEWISKNDKTKYDIVIDGINFQWNHDNIEFIHKDEKAEQIGCIHTTQGYDLNYVGLIFGPEIILNPSTNKIEIRKENYHDSNGKNTIQDIKVLKNYIINIYKTIMLRGILGCYIYVCDKYLRDYFEKHIQIYATNENQNMISTEPSTIKFIPFDNCVPLYSLKVAAGEFVFNDSLPEERFIHVPDGIRITKDHFACKITGNSMNKIVKDGQIALFKRYRGGSNNGLFVIAEYYDYQDVDYGSCYTFKEYFSQKINNEDASIHEKIILKSKSTDSSYQDIEITANSLGEKALIIIGIFDRVIG
jgi:DUF2075 family protein/predicted GIY-YIG superfamily endonuclease